MRDEKVPFLCSTSSIEGKGKAFCKRKVTDKIQICVRVAYFTLPCPAQGLSQIGNDYTQAPTKKLYTEALAKTDFAFIILFVPSDFSLPCGPDPEPEVAPPYRRPPAALSTDPSPASRPTPRPSPAPGPR